jgi:creatinine amidohydrolase
MVWELSNMSWIEADEKFKSAKVVIVPTGAVEQHGPHLGLGADWIQAWNLAKQVGEKTDTLVLPVMPYGVSGHHKDFTGTIFLDPATFQKVILEILGCLNRYGVKKVLFINGHGGNLAALSAAAREARERFGMLCAISQWWEVLGKKTVHGQPAETHGGYTETALMLAARPEAVKMKYAILSPTKQYDTEIQMASLHTAKFREGMIRIELTTAEVSDTGTMTEHLPSEVPGTKDYSKVTKELGESLNREIVTFLCDFVKRFEAFEVPRPHVSREKVLREIEGR